MDDFPRETLLIIGSGSRPTLRRGVKFRHDKERGRWIILAPERIFTPNDVAVEVLRLCDGERTVADIADVLAQSYDADAETIAADIIPVLQELADNGVLQP